MNELDCQDVVELITDHLDGALDAVAGEAFEQHLEECDWCERHLAQTHILIRLLPQVRDCVADPASLPQLGSRLRDVRPQATRSSRHLSQ